MDKVYVAWWNGGSEYEDFYKLVGIFGDFDQAKEAGWLYFHAPEQADYRTHYKPYFQVQEWTLGSYVPDRIVTFKQ